MTPVVRFPVSGFILLVSLVLPIWAVSCTRVETTSDGWRFVDLHPFQDATSAVFTRGAPGSDGYVYAALNHEVRPEGESASMGTLRLGLRTVGLAMMLAGGATGNAPAAVAGGVVAEMTR